MIILFLPPIIVSLPFVQTAIVGLISDKFSERLQTTISVESVNISFFNRVRLNGVYIEDLDRDTLMYISHLDAVIGNLPLNGRPLALNKLRLTDGIFCLRSDSTGTNITKIVKKLKNRDENESMEEDDNEQAEDVTDVEDIMESTFKVKTKSLELKNFRYIMQLNEAPSEEEQPEGIIYKNMSVANINLEADRIAIKNDTLTFRVNDFSFTERSGLNIVQITADTGIICFGREVTLREFRVIDDFSNIKMRNLSLLYNGGSDFSDFINKVNFVVDIYDSHVDFNTLGYFAPALNRIPVAANFNGQITGHVADLRSDNFTLDILDKTYINGRFSIFGLPDIESTMIFVDLKHLDTHSDDVTAIVEGVTGEQFAGKEILDKFGNVHFNGTYTGLVSDFVSYGYLRSALGVMEMDILFKNQNNSTKFSGELATADFDAGKLLSSQLIGHTGFNIEVEGTIQSGVNDIFGEGNISFLEFNDYKYRNVELEGRLVNQSFDGEVKISEPNLELDFNGNIDLEGRNGAPIFKFDANLKHADLVKLNFNKRDTVSIVDANIKANFMASSILDYVGELVVDSLSYTDTQGNVDFGKIVLTSYNDENRNSLSLKSGFMDAEYFGQRDLGGFVDQLQYLSQKYVPELFTATTPNPAKPLSNYGFKAQIKEAKDIVRIIMPDLYIEKGTQLSATIDTGAVINIEINSGKILYGDNQISELKLFCNNKFDSLHINMSGSFATPWAAVNNFNLKNSVFHDKIQTFFSFIDSTNQSDTDISFATRFYHNPETKDKLLTEVYIAKSKITFFGQEWDLSPTTLKISGDKFSVEGFNINREGQQIEISGTASQNSNDSLRIFLSNYRLRGINQYISSLGYQIGGKVSGEIDLYGLYGTPFIISSILIDTLVVNSDTIGNVALGSMWNNDKQCIDVTSRISYNNKLYSSIYGYVFPNSGEIDADVEVKNFQIRTIEPLMSEILSNINGMLNGSVKITGTLTNPDISGKMSLDNVGLTINYLKTHYVVNSNIDITGSKISIYNGHIKDIEGNTGTLNMNLTHDYFKNIKFNASANVTNFLSLSTKSNDNPLFYGTAYTSGVVNLTGNPDLINLAITAETTSNTLFYIPLSSTSQVKESDFLTFVNSKTVSTEVHQTETAVDNDNKESNMKLSFDLAVTPKSEIQILIDPKVGDILRARGNGNLKIYVDPALELFTITGDYSIEEGDYNFTLPNFSIVSRKFMINKGSRIRFNGDVTNAELNVTASYKERVSLATLFPDDSLRNHPVECQIVITGRMTNPLLKFNIDIHDVDPEKKAQFANLVNTDEKMTRQFLSLLVLRAFLPEQNFATQDLGSTTLMYNASELLSGQIGNLISMFNLPIPLDVNVDYTSNAHNTVGAGFEIDVSTQLFDRVLLNGSASNTTTSNRSFVGDIEMEVLLGKNQNTRFKVFSKSRDYFSDDMESNRNGIGLSYRSQFDKFIDIFRRKKKKDKDKEKTQD
ncbi:MAG: translocation/assembly module TamB [Prevotellaceae bacterium]|nr:translocation/assembly module TamB [Prevotellaceae bacterium]